MQTRNLCSCNLAGKIMDVNNWKTVSNQNIGSRRYILYIDIKEAEKQAKAESRTAKSREAEQWRSREAKKNKKAEKQKSGEAEKQRNIKAEKQGKAKKKKNIQRSRKAKKQGHRHQKKCATWGKKIALLWKILGVDSHPVWKQLINTSAKSICVNTATTCAKVAMIFPNLWQTIAGWWFEPLWKLLVSWDDYS